MTAGLGLDGMSWLAGGEGVPGQAGAGTGCLPSSQCSSRGVGSAQAGPGLLGRLSAAPVMALGPGRGWRPGGSDTHQNCTGVGQVMLALEPRAQDSAEGREGSEQPTRSSSLQPVTASPRLPAQPTCASSGKPSLTTRQDAPSCLTGSLEARTPHRSQVPGCHGTR